MSDLIERARMTDEEQIRAFWSASPDLEAPLWNKGVLQAVADAARARALWAVVEWLEEEEALDMQSLRASLRGALITAGLERPFSLLKVDEIDV